MSWSVWIFRVRGIDVKVHLTFLLILVWAAFVWSSDSGAGLRGALYGVVAMLLLFGCVTLHELAHSLQAVAYGIRVREILLLPIGGVSQIEDMPEKPGQELRIALAGPLVSFGLALAFYLLSGLLQTQKAANPALLFTTTDVSWLSLPAYLSVANLLLGLFNLVPAFPMDGGRILRALLAMRLDYRQATRVASAIGQGLALVFGLIGIAVGNLLLVLVAIFVWIGAGEEGGMVAVRGVLRQVTVARAMTREPRVLYPHSLLDDAVTLTLTTLQSDFPVIDDRSGAVVGLLTREDLVKGLQEHGRDGVVAKAMHTKVLTITPDVPLIEAQRRLATAKLTSVPVVDGGNVLVGLLTATDIGEALVLLSATGTPPAA